MPHKFLWSDAESFSSDRLLISPIPQKSPIRWLFVRQMATAHLGNLTLGRVAGFPGRRGYFVSTGMEAKMRRSFESMTMPAITAGRAIVLLIMLAMATAYTHSSKEHAVVNPKRDAFITAAPRIFLTASLGPAPRRALTSFSFGCASNEAK